MNRKVIIQQLRSLKQDASATSDGTELKQIYREVYELMDLLIIEYRKDSLDTAEKLANCLGQVCEEFPSGFKQIRTDILFSIEVCLVVVGAGVKMDSDSGFGLIRKEES